MTSQILLATLPALIVFLSGWLMIKSYLDHKIKQHTLDIKSTNEKDMVMLRLQAYERLVLLMERIKIPGMLSRLQNENHVPGSLYKALIATIRSEFDHNIAQQLYVSQKCWHELISAKESMIKAVNLSKEQSPDEAKMIDFQKLLLHNYDLESKSIQHAIDSLKNEAKNLF